MTVGGGFGVMFSVSLVQFFLKVEVNVNCLEPQIGFNCYGQSRFFKDATISFLIMSTCGPGRFRTARPSSPCSPICSFSLIGSN